MGKGIQRFMMRCIISTLMLGQLTIGGGQTNRVVSPPRAYAASMTSQELLLHEQQTVYLGNLERRKHGLVPLKINWQLTEAARWFARDSIENRPEGYCGHQATDGSWPGERAQRFGYRGGAGAENAFCGFLSPEAAIQGWLDSPGHRANLLDPQHREIGLGTYRRDSDGHGYLAQMFGADSAYPPVVINNEALGTTNPEVEVFVASNTRSGTWTGGMGTAVLMRMNHTPTFDGIVWQPYQPFTKYTLPTDIAWATVYVQTRDALGRTTTGYDTIYMGYCPPNLRLDDASTTIDQVELDLSPGAATEMQFSNNWVADDTDETFALNWGQGERVQDGEALGGTAFELREAGSMAWVWTVGNGFFQGQPMVAYIRMSTTDVTDDELLEITIDGGSAQHGPLHVRGSNFVEPNNYQEFALPFTFVPQPDDEFLKIYFFQRTDIPVRIDAIRFFTAPVPATTKYTWKIPGGNYRGGDIQVRFPGSAETSMLPLKTPIPISTPLPQFPDAALPIPGTGRYTFPETGQTITGLFLNHWTNRGALAQNGYPISPVMAEISELNGKTYTVQYMERVVFEYHPENAGKPSEVLLSQLGTYRYKAKYGVCGAPNQKPNISGKSHLFAETGYTLGGRFLEYWQTHGSLAQQGYPISNEFSEVSDLNGKSYTVQYFERAVFEYHPENKPPFDVLLSQLGTFQYQHRYRGQ